MRLIKYMNDTAKIIGKKVIKTLEIYDYIQVYLEKNSIITINNNYKILKNESEKITLESLNSETLLSFNESTENISLVFTNRKVLIIDMGDDAWHCPEALIIKSDGNTYVWN